MNNSLSLFSLNYACMVRVLTSFIHRSSPGFIHKSSVNNPELAVAPRISRGATVIAGLQLEVSLPVIKLSP